MKKTNGITTKGAFMLTTPEIDTFITQSKSSPLRTQALSGQAYYDGHHDIEGYRVMYVSPDGEWKEDTRRSNVKISHGFFTELVDQQVNYMLSQGEIFQSDDETLQKELDVHFDDEFYAELHECVTGTVVKGYDYMYAYLDSTGKVRFEHADALNVIEVRKRNTVNKVDAVIYHYDITALVDGISETLTKIQVWTELDTTYYVKRGLTGAINKDSDYEVNPQPHVVEVDESTGTRFMGKRQFGLIPFFRLDNNNKRVSGLEPIKPLIDDYDLMSCGLSNNITEAVEAITIVKGFDGEDMGEMIENMRSKRYAGIPSDSEMDKNNSIDFQTVDIPVEARKQKLELDEKNIYRFGMGFDVNSIASGGGNITNILIKSKYANLDLKCDKLEIRLKRFLRKLLKLVLDEINEDLETAYDMADVKLELDREVMTNALDNAQIEKLDADKAAVQVNTLLDVATTLGDEQVLRGLAHVLDLDYDELKRQRNRNPVNLLAEETATLDALDTADEGATVPPVPGVTPAPNPVPPFGNA